MSEKTNYQLLQKNQNLIEEIARLEKKLSLLRAKDLSQCKIPIPLKNSPGEVVLSNSKCTSINEENKPYANITTLKRPKIKFTRYKSISPLKNKNNFEDSKYDSLLLPASNSPVSKVSNSEILKTPDKSESAKKLRDKKKKMLKHFNERRAKLQGTSDL